MPDSAVANPEVDARTRVKHAPRYRVLLHNDNKTPMDFVIDMLRSKFHKPKPAATDIMLQAHHKGISYVDTLPLEQAEFRVDQVHSLARTHKYPLKFTYEPEE